MTPAAAEPLRAYYVETPADVQRQLCVAAQAGDRKARDALVAANLAIVIQRARRFARFIDSGITGDDLVTEGVLGLLHAIDKFDPAREVKFLTYADHWIKQAMLRAVHNAGRTIRVPVHLLETRTKINKARERLVKRRVYSPTVEELAIEANVSVEKARVILGLPSEPTSFDAPLSDDAPTLLETVPADEVWADDRLALAELRYRVRAKAEALDRLLDDRKRAIFVARFFTDEVDGTLEAIGEQFDLSRERIRQIELELRELLRHEFAPEWDDYQGLRRKGPTRAPAVLKATMREIEAAKQSIAGEEIQAPSHAEPSRRGQYIATVAHHVSNFGWPKSALSRHAQFIAQAFEWEMEPIQCALSINRRESERAGRKRR